MSFIRKTEDQPTGIYISDAFGVHLVVTDTGETVLITLMHELAAEIPGELTAQTPADGGAFSAAPAPKWPNGHGSSIVLPYEES